MVNENKTKLLGKVAIARKVNAVISLICTVLILVHGTYDALWMMLRGKISTLPKPMAFVLMGLVILHTILSIVTAILGSGGKPNKKEKMYKKENIKTLIQRIFGILMVVMLTPHIIGMGNHLAPKGLHSVIHPIFFLAVYGHTAISCSKAFITLGIGNAKLIKVIDRIASILCVLIFVASIVGLYLVMYGRWLG